MVDTDWDYTHLANSYLKRAPYADEAISAMLKRADLGNSVKACDVGAGTGNLTIKLAEKGFQVNAVEPNDAMRAHGIKRTAPFKNVQWTVGTGENTGQPDNSFELVTFGSSFNVTKRSLALKEAARILKPKGWFACMWNHRDLENPVQAKIESLIKNSIPNYDYGARREDQEPIINESKLFGTVIKLQGRTIHFQTADDIMEAWRSHATLIRQAGNNFSSLMGGIEKIVSDIKANEIQVPYVTRIWLAQLESLKQTKI